MRRRESNPLVPFLIFIVVGGAVGLAGVAAVTYAISRGAKAVMEEVGVIDSVAELGRRADRESVKVRGKVMLLSLPQKPTDGPRDPVAPIGTVLFSDGSRVSCLFAEVSRDEYDSWRRNSPSTAYTLTANVAHGPQLYNCRMTTGSR